MTSFAKVGLERDIFNDPIPLGTPEHPQIIGAPEWSLYAFFLALGVAGGAFLLWEKRRRR